MFPYCCLFLSFLIHSLFSFQGASTSFCSLVGQSGLEPPTSRLSVVCSSQLSYWPMFLRFRHSPSFFRRNGGDLRDRFSAEKPRRLQHATGMLSRVGFRSRCTESNCRQHFSLFSSFRNLVEISGIEPLTSCLQGRRSPS